MDCADALRVAHRGDSSPVQLGGVHLARVCSMGNRYRWSGRDPIEDAPGSADRSRLHDHVFGSSSGVHGPGDREIFENDRPLSASLERRRSRLCTNEILRKTMTARRLRVQGGFCVGGCVVLSVVVLVIVGAVLWGAYSTYQGAYMMTSPHPRSFEPVPPLGEQNAARLKWKAFQDALQKGDEVEFRFTADDLNAWFFADGKNADLIPHLRFRTLDDWIVAEVSVPLRFMADVPMLPSF